MRMASTSIDLETATLCATLACVRNHTTDSKLKNHLGVLLAELGGSGDDLIADVACVACVDLGAFLIASEHDLISVDHDDVIATVNVGREDRLVLTTEKLCCFDCDLTEHLIGGVDHIPFALNVLSFG